MYHFAVIALLALGTLKLVDFLTDNVPGFDNMRSMLTFVGSIGAVLLLDYSLFDGWGVAVDSHDVGVWITGFMVAGGTSAWRAVFGYLTHDRATYDETLGEHKPMMKRVA